MSTSDETPRPSYVSGDLFDRQGGPTRILRSEKAEPIKS